MKRVLLSCFIILQACHLYANLEWKVSGDGIAVITLNASGDLANGISQLPSEVMNATKLTVITADGVSMSNEDMMQLCGDYNIADNFKEVRTLDLERARVENDSELWRLRLMGNLKTITFPRTTTKIPDQCLLNKKNEVIEEVIIPDNPERSLTIGSQAFNVSTLKRVVLGSVSSGTIGTQVFLDCTSLTTVDFHAGWTNLGTQSFMGCTALKNIILPEGVTEIGYGAFSGSAIEAIRLPSTLKYIRSTAFLCTNLKTITIPEGVELIEYNAFQECYNLSDVYVLGTHTKAANQAFQPANTYFYAYNGAGNGETVDRWNYTSTAPAPNNMQTITVLHYPEAAYDNYINENTKTLGKEGNSEKWVQDADKNRWAVEDKGLYDHQTGDYAGWKNFMLTAKIKDSEIWEDPIRVEDKWYTMCLPFDMTEFQLKSAYGAGVEVVEFSGVTVETDSERNKTIMLKFKQPVTETKAHHPYMIHPSIHAGSTTGVKVVIAGISKQPETQTNLDKEKVTHTADDVTYTFIGNYEQNRHLEQYSYYYYSGNDSQYKNGFYKWPKANEGTWTQYTACVLLSKDNGANAKALMAFATLGETESSPATGIADVLNGVGNTPATTAASGVYTLSGQRVRERSTDLSGLPEGIYIVNGKKYVVK